MRSTVWVGGLAALFLPFAAVEAQESSDSDGVRHVGKIHNRLRAAEARQEYFLDQEFDDASRRYARAKKEIQKSTGIFYSMTSSVLSQWGAPGSDYGAVQAQFSPSVNWRAFRDPELGAGSFQFAYLATQYWSGQTGTSLQNRLGLNSPVNDYPVNQLTFAQVSYTHDFPGHFVSVTLGQFPFSNFDGNAYANNEQVNFIGYSLAQNGSQNYSQGSLGAYVQLNPTQEITLAAGLQDANNVLASNYIQLNTAAQGQYSWFVYGAWSPLSGQLFAFLLQPSERRDAAAGELGPLVQRLAAARQELGAVRPRQHRLELEPVHPVVDRRRRGLQQPAGPGAARPDRSGYCLEQGQPGPLCQHLRESQRDDGGTLLVLVG